ncbi:MAG: pseudouridine synthase [Eubacteriales bacterium]|nr:pseudouridine synthase [Eubacteriales bacterium]
MNEKRLNKFLSEQGLCSRREADTWIEAGRVSVNGQIASLGTKITAADRVRVDGRDVKMKARKHSYYALNKPRGIVCTCDPKEKNNIVDYLGVDHRVFPIGRLDKDSEGLILLTDDGDIVNRILRARYKHEKEYLVETREDFDDDFLSRMASGVRILGTKTEPCRVERISSRRFKIVLTQGLNRQIRRMCEALGHEVVFLRRIRIMNISLGKLGLGEYRPLGYKELQQVLELIERAEARERAKPSSRKGARD